MPDHSKLIEELNQQLVDARNLLASPEWLVWSNFLKKDRREFLQNRINAAVKDRNWEEASLALALYNDCLKQIELFRSFVKNTENQIKELKK